MWQLRRTEGFLAADVSSAALQRDGWNIREKEERRGGERERLTKVEAIKKKKKRVEPSWWLRDAGVLVEHLHEASRGK